MSSHLSSAIFNSILTISIPKKVAVHRHAKTNAHDRTVRIPAHSTPQVVFQPSAMMVDGTSKDIRPIITIHQPSMWGDIFSTSSVDPQVQQKYSEEIEVLKKEARSMLMAATSTKLMILIDKLERLGLAYHFNTEIEEKLKQLYDSTEEEEEEEQDDCDLYTTALRFRLLRQHQYHVSCDAFAKFVDKDNRLKENLISSDVDGLLSLYEAAHVRIHDENFLEQAVAFTTHHLSSMLPQLESPLREKEVRQALNFPLHKSPAFLTIRSYIDMYENDASRDELLLKLAKLNFNFMQNVFRNELFELTKWWKKFNITSKLPYVRDKLVENYIWSLSFHIDPHYSLARMGITKFYMLTMVMDDTYDNYATLEEIELFTRALQRWNMDEIDVLPNYLNVAYKFIMSYSEGFEREAEKQGKSYVIPYYIEAVKKLGTAYAQEQKWIREKQIPSFEEYMAKAGVTALVHISFIALVPLVKSGSKETIDWVLSDPEILNAANAITRLLDDLASHQRESKDGTVLTPMDQYFKDKGASRKEIESEIKVMIEDKWKDLNAAWMNCSTIPKEITIPVLELMKMCHTYYKNEEDGFTYPEKSIAPLANALLLEPILI